MPENSEIVCEKHNITEQDIRDLPEGYNDCPYCEEERSIAAQEQHKMTRDPQVEPW